MQKEKWRLHVSSYEVVGWDFHLLNSAADILPYERRNIGDDVDACDEKKLTKTI